MASVDATTPSSIRDSDINERWALRLRWILPITWLAIVLAASLAIPAVAPYSHTETSEARLQAPSKNHLFGTDELGRDMLVRVARAGRTSLWIAISAVAVGMAGGVLLGALAAVRKGVVSSAIMRVVDILLAFPAIILALVFALMLGKGTGPVVLVIGIVLVPQIVRMVRARLVSELQREYVIAERGAGSSTWRILWYHVARNTYAPILAFGIVALAEAVVFEAALSFLGLGVQPPEPSWGNILSSGQAVMLAGGWWVSLIPGLILVATILSINALVDADAVREARDTSGARA